MRFQERHVLKDHLQTMEPFMSTRDNIYYTKLRDDIREKSMRITKMKQKELED